MESGVKRISEVSFHLERFTKQDRIKISFSWPSRAQETRHRCNSGQGKESNRKFLNSYDLEVLAFIAQVKLKTFPEIS